MRKLLVALIVLFSITLSGQTPTYLVWDYPIAELPSISEFQVRYDNGAYQTVGIPNGETFSDTQPGHQSFRALIPSSISSGASHTVYVRSCNGPSDCSFDASLVFKFIGPPSNLRIKK